MAVASLALAVLLVVACTPRTTPDREPAGDDTGPQPIAVRIGVLSSEDELPLWVAQQNGYFTDEGLPEVEIVSFQSAQERDVAFASGALDAFMGDMVAAANLEAGGSPCSILSLMLGADTSQGRFGVAVPPGSAVTTMTQLAGVPVGTSSATIQEYVLDGLMTEAGVGDGVRVEEVKKVPVRYELLMQGKLQAAALPDPYLALAEQGGATVVGDDTKAAQNYSQTTLVFSDDFLTQSAGSISADAVLAAWDRAVEDINADPEAYRALMVDKTRLPGELENTYKMSTYPTHQLPDKERVDAILQWMRSNGYLKSADVDYESLTLITPPEQ